MEVATAERLTNAKTGKVCLPPEIEIDSSRTNIDCPEEQCVAGYHGHGTGEQFHSELKTGMSIEKLPVEKFATNALTLNITALALNCLRIMGRHFLNKPQLLHREYKVVRRRLRSEMQDFICIACKVMKHAGCIWLSFSRENPHYRIFKDLYVLC